MKMSKQNRFFKYLKSTANWTCKICIAAAAMGVTYSNPITGIPVGAVVICSMISSLVKDRNSTNLSKIGKFISWGMRLINKVAQNDGYAKNDPKINK